MSLTRGEARERGWLGNKTMPDLMSAPTALPLDLVSGALAGYSVARLIRAAYSGPLIRVRRSSDNTELDIGVDASGNLDTSALLAFVGAGSGFLRTLYDQSSNALHAGQATTTQQPRIVNSGALDLLNSRPAAIFDGSNDVLASSAAGSTTTATTLLLAGRIASASGEDVALGLGLSTDGSNRGRYLYRGPSGSVLVFTCNSSGPAQSTLSWDAGGVAHSWLASIASGTAVTCRRDGVQVSATLSPAVSSVLNTAPVCIGGLTSSGLYYTALDLLEAYVFPSQLSSGDSSLLEDSIAWYFSTPATPRALTQYGVKR